MYADGPGPLGTAEDGGSEKEGVAATGAGVTRAADTRPEVRREARMQGHSSHSRSDEPARPREILSKYFDLGEV